MSIKRTGESIKTLKQADSSITLQTSEHYTQPSLFLLDTKVNPEIIAHKDILCLFDAGKAYLTTLSQHIYNLYMYVDLSPIHQQKWFFFLQILKKENHINAFYYELPCDPEHLFFQSLFRV